MTRTLYRMHPLCKFVLSGTIVAFCFTTWELTRLGSLCGLLLTLILLDLGKSTIRDLLVSVLLCAALMGVAILFQNTLARAAGLVLHLEAMALAAIFMFTTPVADLLRSLQSYHVPDGLMLGFLIVFRFVNVLRNDLSSIYLASTMVPKGAISAVGKIYRCITVPFVYRMFVLSDQLGASVTSRDYGICPRSQYRLLPIRTLDAAIALVTVIAAGVILWMP